MSNIYGNTYWNSINKNQLSYPKINSDVKCHTVIIGGGITGCVTNYFLSLYNIDTVLLENSFIGHDTALSSNGIIDIGYDTLPVKLFDIMKENEAIRALKLTEKSFDDLQVILDSLHKYCGFQVKEKFNILNNKSIESQFISNFNFLSGNNINCQFLDEISVSNFFSFYGKDGISYKKSAIIDPYKLCHILLKSCRNRGSQIFEFSPVESIESKTDEIIIYTENHKINCKSLILTSPYAIKNFIKKDIFTSYTSSNIVTEPVKTFHGWYNKCNIEYDENYKFMFRTTLDNRIFATCINYTSQDYKDFLLNKIKELFPNISPPKIDYFWSSVEETTSTGIPYIGTLPPYSNTFINISNQKNIIPASIIGGFIIKDLLLYKYNPDSKIYSFPKNQ